MAFVRSRLHKEMMSIPGTANGHRETSPSPLVSVVIPMFNASPYIETAVRSVQMQTLEDWELIIVDNFSTDKSRDIVLKIIEQDKRVHLLSTDEHFGGPSRPRNVGMCNARGKYIAFLDADDWWCSSDKLEKQTDIFRKDDDMFMVFSRILVHQKGDEFWVEENENLSNKCDNASLSKRLFLANFIPIQSVIIRNEGIQQNFLFDENPKRISVEDWDLWLRIVQSGKKTTSLDYRCCVWRKRDGSLLHRRIIKRIPLKFSFFWKWKKIIPPHKLPGLYGAVILNTFIRLIIGELEKRNIFMFVVKLVRGAYGMRHNKENVAHRYLKMYKQLTLDSQFKGDS